MKSEKDLGVGGFELTKTAMSTRKQCISCLCYIIPMGDGCKRRNETFIISVKEYSLKHVEWTSKWSWTMQIGKNASVKSSERVHIHYYLSQRKNWNKYANIQGVPKSMPQFLFQFTRRIPDYTLKKIRYLSLSETLLGFPIVINTEFFLECSKTQFLERWKIGLPQCRLNTIFITLLFICTILCIM
jgi:hypothetical protein